MKVLDDCRLQKMNKMNEDLQNLSCLKNDSNAAMPVFLFVGFSLDNEDQNADNDS